MKTGVWCFHQGAGKKNIAIIRQRKPGPLEPQTEASKHDPPTPGLNNHLTASRPSNLEDFGLPKGNFEISNFSLDLNITDFTPLP